MVKYPSKKSGEVLRLLQSLGYRVERTKGSHSRLVASGRPPLLYAYHRGVTVPPRALRHILEREVGLSEDEIVELLWGRRHPGEG
ncbi:MAG: type II toxin-antitoxin system HicA family toxin [bacterium]|nr:type II toxin-antitoxin system HicA family toxin [bacterium]